MPHILLWIILGFNAKQKLYLGFCSKPSCVEKTKAFLINVALFSISAPSNAAVDEIVRKLLDCRQRLKHEDRFALMRIGKPHVIHPDVRSICFETLRDRNLSRNQKIGQNEDSLKLQVEESNRRIDRMTAQISDLSKGNYEISKLHRQMREEIAIRDRAKKNLKEMNTQVVDHKERQRTVEELFHNADIIAATLNR